MIKFICLYTKLWIVRTAIPVLILFCCPILCAGIDNLFQVNPIKKAPSSISSSNHRDGYPVFSDDGKLFLFTRDIGTTIVNSQLQGTADWDIFVTYLSNRGVVVAHADDDPLPTLTVAAPIKISSLSTAGKNEKAIAYCEIDPPSGSGPVDYHFDLFYSRDADDDPNSTTKQIRKADVTIRVNTTSNPITIGAITLNSDQPLPSTVNVANGDGQAPTEPILTRDGNFLFWAAQFTTQARQIQVASACSQFGQIPKYYSALPSTRFPWIAQYGSPASPDKAHTKSTNYHAVIDMTDSMGVLRTGLIFERCHAAAAGSSPGDRECECDQNYNTLQFTGFVTSTNRQPPKIGINCPTTCLTVEDKLNTTPQGTNCAEATSNPPNSYRVTHPWIAGPRQANNGAWLLFFTRLDKNVNGGHNIYYTRIRYVP